MIQRIQKLNRGQRTIIFILMFGGGAFLLFAAALTGILLTYNASPRVSSTALVENMTVAEFVQLPDDDAYPATVEVDMTGNIYTASYVSGTVWRISPEGAITELPGTRDQFGAVTALSINPEGAIFVLDRVDSDFRAQGGIIWRMSPTGEISEFGRIDDTTGFVAPDDLAIDLNGNVYVSDRGRREVWRFDNEGVGALWWVVPPDVIDFEQVIATGLAYDPSNPSIIITDPETDAVFRVSLDGQTTETLYRNDDAADTPAYDGVTISPDGVIYLAGLGDNSVSRLRNGEMTIIANRFRGSSDVALYGNRLYVTNFDQRSLAPPPGLRPRLPFGLDVVNLGDAN